MKPIDSLDKCTTCTTCVAYCPVTRATRAFRGPKLTGPASERFRLLDEMTPGPNGEIEALDYCSNCKNCDIACPSGVKISTLNMMARGDWCREHKPPLRDWVLSHGTRFGALARLFPAALVRLGMTNPLTRWLLDRFGVSAKAPLPVYASKSFRQLFAEHMSGKTPGVKKVVFFPGCYIEDYAPQTGMDLVFLLERAGYEVIVPQTGCCGVPLIANGFMDEAAEAARVNSAELVRLSSPDVPILTLCPSCGLMLGQEYGEFFPDVDDVHTLSPRLEDACEFLIGLVERGELDISSLRPDRERLIYHAPCHLRAQGIGKPGLELLRMLGTHVEDAQAGCCGISGSYGFKKEKYDVATTVGKELFQTVKKSGATCCVSECGTCRLQISHHTGVPTMHPVSRLRQMLN